MRKVGYMLIIVFILCFLSAGYYLYNNYYKSVSEALVTNIEFNETNSYTKEIILHTNKGKFIIPANIQDMAYSQYDNRRMIRILNIEEDDEHFNELSEKIKSFLSTEVILNQTTLDIEYTNKKQGKVVSDLYYLIKH